MLVGLIRLTFLFAFVAGACVVRAQATPSIGPAIDPAPAADANNAKPTENWKMWNQSDIVFIGQLKTFKAGPVAQSMPPIYSNQLSFTVVKTLRGILSDATVPCWHSYHAMNNFPYEVGKQYIVALTKGQQSNEVLFLLAANKDAIAEAEMACALPLGWTLENGKPVSPWAALGAWTAKLPADFPAPKYTCAKTGRPALLAGDAVQFDVAAVPPAKSIEWTNPDGDGEYKITITNPTDKPITVPALLTQKNNILWKESLAILCQGKSYACPGVRVLNGNVVPLTLKPKESVSTVINALALTGPEWPQGGYRIEFTFCLGEKAKTMSFYYMSRYHDKLRDEAHKFDSAG